MEPLQDHCAYYFTTDQIDNLKIRVSLQQLTGTQLVDASPRAVEESAGGRAAGEELTLATLAVSSVADDPAVTHLQQQNIKWQQKLLSPCEIVEYSRSQYANDPQHKVYHQQAVKLRKRKHWRKRIFTYIHQDKYQSQKPDIVTTSERQEQRDIHLRRRRDMTRSWTSRTEADKDKPGGGGGGHDQTKGYDQKQFYIMADLAPFDSLGENRTYEVILCALRYNNYGQLTVTPDFTRHDGKPYRLESFGSDNALYEYTIENGSVVRSAEERRQDLEIEQQMRHQRVEEIQQNVGSEWQSSELEDGEIRLSVTGEITRAFHFTEASYLYIHYILHLPPGWRVNPSSECEGFTTTCAVDCNSSITSVAHYSTPFTIDVTKSRAGIGWPQLLLAVFSVDCWGRDRDEGYAAFLIPTPGGDCEKGKPSEGKKSGMYMVPTWRPAQTSPFSALRRFFIGGCQLLSDSSYLAVGYTGEKERCSRLGFSTITSGSVELHTHTLVQGHPDTLSGNTSSQWDLPPGWLVSSQAVLEAFNRSRQKLKAAKQGLM